MILRYIDAVAEAKARAEAGEAVTAFRRQHFDTPGRQFEFVVLSGFLRYGPGDEWERCLQADPEELQQVAATNALGVANGGKQKAVRRA